MLINIVFQYLMFYWLIEVRFQFFIMLDFSDGLILIFLIYMGRI